MVYQAIDRWNSPDSLQHWKYIKKIGNRYFYTMEALNAYYKADKAAAGVSRDVANTRIDIRTKIANRDSSQIPELNNAVASGLKAHNNVKAAVQPHVRTAALAIGASSRRELLGKTAASLVKKRGMMTIGKLESMLSKKPRKRKFITTSRTRTHITTIYSN